MRPEAIRLVLQRHRAELEAQGVRSLSLFGSSARGEAGPESDIDLLADLDPEARVGLIRCIEIERRLSDMLGRKVDLISSYGLSPSLRSSIDADARQVF